MGIEYDAVSVEYAGETIHTCCQLVPQHRQKYFFDDVQFPQSWAFCEEVFFNFSDFFFGSCYSFSTCPTFPTIPLKPSLKMGIFSWCMWEAAVGEAFTYLSSIRDKHQSVLIPHYRLKSCTEDYTRSVVSKIYSNYQQCREMAAC